jgi:hypothetical protein
MKNKLSLILLLNILTINAMDDGGNPQPHAVHDDHAHDQADPYSSSLKTIEKVLDLPYVYHCPRSCVKQHTAQYGCMNKKLTEDILQAIVEDPYASFADKAKAQKLLGKIRVRKFVEIIDYAQNEEVRRHGREQRRSGQQHHDPQDEQKD